MCTFKDRVFEPSNGTGKRRNVNNPMIVFPNAKINLGLRILRRRSDGYHDLESLFLPIRFCDILEILPSDAGLNDGNDEISVSGLKVGTSSDNLCRRAVRLFRQRQGTPPVRIHLHKRIPPGSGLGGGSSDASFTLLALNEMFGCGLEEEVLLEYASELGSDCPFFVLNRPCLAGGRGDVLEPFTVPLQGYHLALLIPEIRIQTEEAYRMVRPCDKGDSLRDVLAPGPERWKGRIVNDFEKPVIGKYTEIGTIRDELYASGAVYASMSGSGSAVYGLFRSAPSLDPRLRSIPHHVERLNWESAIAFPPSGSPWGSSPLP